MTSTDPPCANPVRDQAPPRLCARRLFHRMSSWLQRFLTYRRKYPLTAPTTKAFRVMISSELRYGVFRPQPRSRNTDEPSPEFPSYAQLNAALRNLSPEQLSQDQPSPGFPTYEQLAQALRNLSPPTPVTDTSNNGFPTYGQLAAALRNLRTEPRRSRAPRSPRAPRYAALATISELVPVPRHLLPQGSVHCQHYGAMKWPSELPNACWFHGDVKLAAAETPPPRVCELYSQRSLDKIRGYNSALAITSTEAMEDRTVNRDSAPYTFRVNGFMHHHIGQPLPPEGANPTFAQVYVYDGSTEEDVALRGLAILSGLNHTTLGGLQSIMHDINPLAAVYQSARDHASASQEMCLVLLDN
ncbi:hypothetical protein JG688_00018588, partial [Phytophthora aleatoria]